MFGRTVFGAGLQMGRTFFKPTCNFTYSNAINHIETQANFLRMNPVTNSLALLNLREILLAKREVVDLQVADLTSMSQVISLILRGTLTAKCQPLSH